MLPGKTGQVGLLTSGKTAGSGQSNNRIDMNVIFYGEDYLSLVDAIGNVHVDPREEAWGLREFAYLLKNPRFEHRQYTVANVDAPNF